MKPIKQRHPYGCGVACTAFILNTSYQNALRLFEKGKEKAENSGFFCKEIVGVLENAGMSYTYKYVNDRVRKKIYKSGTIVFIKRSKKYPSGHYLTRYKNVWMDAWINFSDDNKKAGFRKRLPGRPIYAILNHKE